VVVSRVSKVSVVDVVMAVGVLKTAGCGGRGPIQTRMYHCLLKKN